MGPTGRGERDPYRGGPGVRGPDLVPRGRVATDLLGDRAFRVLPADRYRCRRLGARGACGSAALRLPRERAGLDVPALEQLLLHVGLLADEVPEAAALNPAQNRDEVPVSSVHAAYSRTCRANPAGESTRRRARCPCPAIAGSTSGQRRCAVRPVTLPRAVSATPKGHGSRSRGRPPCRRAGTVPRECAASVQHASAVGGRRTEPAKTVHQRIGDLFGASTRSPGTPMSPRSSVISPAPERPPATRTRWVPRRKERAYILLRAPAIRDTQTRFNVAAERRVPEPT
jgi:hypothetical protein